MHFAGKTLLAVPAMALALGLPATSATAAGGQQQPPQQQQSSHSDADLRAYAEAAIEVSELQRQYQGQLQQAGSAEEQQAIQEEANAAMIEAIEGSGLSLEKYNAIATDAQNNQQLAQQIRTHVEQALEDR